MNQFATVRVNYTLMVVRPLRIVLVGVGRSTEKDLSYFYIRLFQLRNVAVSLGP